MFITGQSGPSFATKMDSLIKKNAIFESKEAIAHRTGISVLQEKEAMLHHINII